MGKRKRGAAQTKSQEAQGKKERMIVFGDNSGTLSEFGLQLDENGVFRMGKGASYKAYKLICNFTPQQNFNIQYEKQRKTVSTHDIFTHFRHTAPTSVILSITKRYILTLVRQRSLSHNPGGHTIKKYAQSLPFPIDALTYQFPIEKTDMIKLKLQSEHDLDFQWELFKLQGKMSTFSQSIPINLMEFYRIYVHSIIKSGIDFDRMRQDLRKGQFQARRWEIDRESLQWEFTEIIGKSAQKDVQIAYRLQIWNQFDIFAQNHGQKIHTVLSGGTMRKNASQQSQQDESSSNLPFDPCKSPKQGSQSPKGSVKRNFFPSISMLKRNSALSEIIECSNQNSSIVNFGQRYAQLQEIQGIPEEENDQSPYTQSGETFRRSNTLDSGLYQFPPARCSRKKLSTPQRKLSEDGDKDSFGRTETGLQSYAQGEVKENKPLSSKMSPKMMIVLVICLLAIGILVYSKIDPSKTIKKALKKPSKKAQKSQPPPKLPKKQKEVRKR